MVDVAALELLGAVLSRASEASKNSRIHGPTHWAGVAAAGLTLLDRSEAPGADPLVVLLFALFHDSMRDSDGYDPEHGLRGARLAREMRDTGEYDLDDERLELLEEACRYHDKGETSSEPTIGACWDADRLNLWRVGRRPDAALLSTPAARRLPEHSARIFSALMFDWRALFLNFDISAAGENTVYLRFGDLPPDGKSAVPLLGLRESGVSAYPGSVLEDGSYILDFRRLVLGIDTRFLAWVIRQARPLYLVEGRPVGVGGMGEPVLEGARLVEEVPACSVDVLPDRPAFRALIEAWRAKRRGEVPDPSVWLDAPEPDERPAFPFAITGNAGETFGEMVEEQVRERLARWGLLEDYDRMRSKPQTPRSPKPREDYWNNTHWNQTPWEVKPWM